jgi:hypothetical protein
MFASYASVGPGIGFVLALLFVILICVAWFAVWLPQGLRSQWSRAHNRVRNVARCSFVVTAVLMFSFPRFRRTGTWTDPQSGAAIPAELSPLYDRSYFGYIPTYAFVGRSFTAETPVASGTLRLHPHAAYQLDAVSWRVEWWFLFGQLGIALLFAVPFLAARGDPQIAEQTIEPKLNLPYRLAERQLCVPTFYYARLI